MESVVNRKVELLDWLLSDCGLRAISISAMQGDASFRRYFRIESDQGCFVAMDAPPPQENVTSFVAIATFLRSKGITAPEIFFADKTRGFLLISDFGYHTYLNTLNPGNAEALYASALLALANMQTLGDVPTKPLPLFNREFMYQEWAWHKEWYLGKYLKVDNIPTESLDACFAILVESAVSQPQVFMHRDYHSANLMVLPEGGVGILDFQDAFLGPVTYDLVSLLRDCYIDWPAERVTAWVNSYLSMLQARGMLQDVDQATFMRWFDLMGIERHLKALFTFARKQVRDYQPQYLRHMPRTLGYILSVSAKYPELLPLHDYLQTINKKAIECVP